MSYLRSFPFDKIKIDQSFVREISDDSKSTIPVIQAIVELAHGMGLSVVAEGVENEGQLHALRVLGCDILQGYLLHRPGPPEEIEKVLRLRANALLNLDQYIRESESAAIPVAELQPHRGP